MLARTGGCGGGELLDLMRTMSTDCERLLELEVMDSGSAVDVDDAQCWERIDRDSSIGVKILRDLDIRFTGSSICWTGACCCCSGSCCGGGGGWCC